MLPSILHVHPGTDRPIAGRGRWLVCVVELLLISLVQMDPVRFIAGQGRWLVCVCD